jgi:GNAT superfamily N-acetyltransferase
MISVLPPARLFPSPRRPFDTERAVLGAANLVRPDGEEPALAWVSAHDRADAPHIAIVGGAPAGERAPGAIAERLLCELSRARTRDRRFVVVDSIAMADGLAPALLEAGFSREDLRFYGVDTRVLADGPRLALEPLVGDAAWREWTIVQRPILAEAIAPRAVTDAMIDRGMEFKRRQQRNSPPIRRFLGRDGAGTPIAMIGYAPFASCDLGFARRGPLVRLRDVAVVPEARRAGHGLALLRALSARAIDECGATQMLIGGAADGAAAALYRRAGARSIDAYVIFSTNGETPLEARPESAPKLRAV